MKACVLHDVGDLRCEEVPTPTPKRGEALVKIAACGVCGSDIPRIFTKGTYRFPLIPGHEMSGRVVEVGDKADNAWIGKPVVVFPLIPCRKCHACEIGAYSQCASYDYLGSRSDGGFAEYVCAPAWNLVEIPKGVPLDVAAMTEPAAVAFHALERADMEPGKTVLIFGAGPVGLMVAQRARIWEAGKVLLVDIDPARLDLAATLGFEHTFNAATDDPVPWTLDSTGLGPDIVIEASGSSRAFGDALCAARLLGEVVLLGNPCGDMNLSQEQYWAIMRKELTVRGTWNSSYDETDTNDWICTLDHMASGELNLAPLISHRLDLDHLRDALILMRDRTEFTSKVMCVASES